MLGASLTTYFLKGAVHRKRPGLARTRSPP